MMQGRGKGNGREEAGKGEERGRKGGKYDGKGRNRKCGWEEKIDDG